MTMTQLKKNTQSVCQKVSFALIFLGSLAFTSKVDAQHLLHRIHIGETLSSISQHYYKKRSFASIIAKHNNLQLNQKLRTTSRIRIPSAWIYITTRRTRLAHLARKLLGDKRKADVLQYFNPKLPKKRIIKADTEILVPFGLSHRVETSDSLSKLAKRYLGDARLARLIETYNLLKSKPSEGSTVLIPIGHIQITKQRLRELTNRRILGIKRDSKQQQRALIEANAALRQGDFWKVPLELIRLLASEVESDIRLVDIFKILAIAYVALNQQALAIAAFKEALLRQPNLQLSPMSTSPKVIKALHAARAALSAN